MAQVKRGDEAAFAQILARHEGTVRRLCQLLLRDRGDDIAQDVFLTLWTERARYQPQAQLRAYLCTIARRRCFSVMRRDKLLRLFMQLPTAHSFDPRGQDDLLRALRNLPTQFQVPLHLRFVEDMDYADIARVIGRTESAARSRIHHGLKALTALWEGRS